VFILHRFGIPLGDALTQSLNSSARTEIEKSSTRVTEGLTDSDYEAMFKVLAEKHSKPILEKEWFGAVVDSLCYRSCGCAESLEVSSQEQDLVFCVGECGKALHEICFKKWKSFQGHTSVSLPIVFYLICRASVHIVVQKKE
jgi:hypothetical protein